MKTVAIPDALLDELERRATGEGVSVAELAEDALRRGLVDRTWDSLLAYGQRRGAAMGFREEQAGELVHEFRRRPS